MGVQYTIADHKNRRLYRLDKAYRLHYGLCREETFTEPCSLDEFRTRFATDERSDLSEGRRDRLARVVRETFDFCEAAEWDVSLLTDDDDGFVLRLLLDYGYVGWIDHAEGAFACRRCGRDERPDHGEVCYESERDALYRRRDPEEGRRHVERLRQRRTTRRLSC